MTSAVTRDQIAEAIHNSVPFGRKQNWVDLPASDRNPQRVLALAAADAVIALFSSGDHDTEDVAAALRAGF
jgi:hypothetical protein